MCKAAELASSSSSLHWQVTVPEEECSRTFDVISVACDPDPGARPGAGPHGPEARSDSDSESAEAGALQNF